MWGYDQENGPDCWGDKFPAAKGRRQSPVDINTADVVPVTPTGRLKVALPPVLQAPLLSNTGHGWQVAPASPDDGGVVSGGTLSQRYRFQQFHMHWGDCLTSGSEHTVNGAAFPGELHFVHWNEDKYQSFQEAASQPDGLVVLGVFLQGGGVNKEFSQLTAKLSNIPNQGDTVTLPSLDLEALLPMRNGRYWTYEGSLTTPPCLESVTWIVYKTPLTIDQQDLDHCRSLCCNSQKGGPAEFITKNYRPTQPLCGRVIREVPGSDDE